jgi:hypothetical protein
MAAASDAGVSSVKVRHRTLKRDTYWISAKFKIKQFNTVDIAIQSQGASVYRK